MKKLIILLFIMVIHTLEAYAILLINKEEPVYYFVNHEEQISELRKKLLTDKIVGITGITGMGKSEMVRKYVQEYKQDYEIIAFLDASIDLTSQFITVAKEINQQICLKAGCYIAEDHKNVKKSLMTYLKPKGKWLLIFDNLHINENEKIKDIINWHHNGHIIICSQDSKYLLPKISTPYLKEEHAIVIINKIMKNPSSEFVKELVQSLKGYPTYMIGHSAIFLQNNNHTTIKEYINYMEKHENKIKAHLDITLKEITKPGVELLYKMTLLNIQRIPRYLLEQLIADNDSLSNVINEMIRFGLIEQISEDRNNQVFRMHDAVKEELLNMAGNKLNQQNINFLLDKFNNIIPDKVNDRLDMIKGSSFFESNLEILLNNTDKYNADLYKIMELREKLLWYYLIGQRQADNARKMVDWFKKNVSNVNLLFRSDKEKAVYSGYLTFIGIYEGVKYSVTNHQTLKVIIEYLDRAEEIVKEISNYEELKSYIFSIKALVQINMGDITEAKINVIKAEQVRPAILKTFLGAGLVEYNKSKILIAEGQYQKALDMLSIDISKTTGSKNSLHLAPEYITQSTILNYMQRFQEAYNVVNDNIYQYVKSKKKEENILIDSYILAQTLTELSRSELGLGKKEEALNHASEAVSLLIEDKDRNNTEDDLDDSTDVFLANALVAKADALSAIGKIQEAMDTYTLAKHIYWNVYGIKNIGNMDNVGYAFAQAAKTAVNLPDKHESHIQCFYFYSLLRDYFGVNHHRTKEVQGICP